LDEDVDGDGHVNPVELHCVRHATSPFCRAFESRLARPHARLLHQPPMPNVGDAIDRCEQCDKPRAICVCDRTVPLETRTEVLVLEHPQERREVLASAPLVRLSLPRATVRVGLSWPSLSAALGRDVDAKRWGILYLGSLRKPLTDAQRAKPFVLLDRNGDEIAPRPGVLQGIVVLDGTWSQAKTIWWRNPWMLKLNRVVLHPREPSAYGRLRAQSQREHVSTIEAVADTLDALGESHDVKAQLVRLFRTMVQRARDAQNASVPGAPTAPVKREGRRPKRARAKSRGGGPLD
jgi:DTW domain-containing protein YfiP